MTEKRAPRRVIWQAHPSWKGMLPWYLKGAAAALVISALAYLLYSGNDLSTFKFVLVVLVSFGTVIGVGALVRKTTVYTITTEDISERSGIIRTRQDKASHAQITNVTVERSLWERLLGIGHVNFDTAGEQNRDYDLLNWWGVEKPYDLESLADRLRYGEWEPDEG